MELVLVSACLIGVGCRYDGGDCYHPDVEDWHKEHVLLPVCPEQIGGLSTPRPKAHLVEGDGFDVLAGRARVTTIDGDEDVTEQFIRGAQEVANLAQRYRIKQALLKSKSPSCGCGHVVIEGTLQSGSGVTAARLSQMGVEVVEL